jgi:hypothetical protein
MAIFSENQKYSIAILAFILFSLTVSATDSFTCKEKLDELEALKKARSSWIEKAGACVFYGGVLCIGENKLEEQNAEKIRVLEMELQGCR